MSLNEKLAKYLKHVDLPIQYNIPLSKMADDVFAWPDNPCATCKWWFANMPEGNLGQCRTIQPRIGKSPANAEYALTPPNHCCRNHWRRGLSSSHPTYKS